MGDRHGLIVDFGGVLTTDVFASFRAFCDAEVLPPETVRDRFRSDPEARDLQRGRAAQARSGDAATTLAEIEVLLT